MMSDNGFVHNHFYYVFKPELISSVGISKKMPDVVLTFRYLRSLSYIKEEETSNEELFIFQPRVKTPKALIWN